MRDRFIPIVAAAALLVPSVSRASADAEAAKLLPFEAVETTLPNGLKVIVVPTGFPNIVSIQIPVQTGSRNEVEPGKSGFAHFFEHMMFRGTPAYPPDVYQGLLTRAGARQNAYTTDDYTNYHTTFAKEDLETILRIEADRFRNLKYAEPEFKTEARAVLGEYNKNSADPVQKLIEVQRDHAFRRHTYKHTTMGFLRDIEDMPNQFEYSHVFFDRWYRPEHTALIVAGDVRADEVLPLVEKHWGGWERGSYTVDVPQEPEPQGPVYAHVEWPSPTLPWVAVAFHAPAFSETEKDHAALTTLLDLSFGPTSELYKRLVETEQKVDQLFDYYPGNQDAYLATVAARVKDPADALYVRDRILEAFARATTTAPPAQRLADAKASARYGLLRRLDNTDAIASTLARFVRYRRSYHTLDNLYRVHASLTPEDLLAAARRSFTDARLSLTTLSQAPLPEGIGRPPELASLLPAAAAAGAQVPVLVQRSALPQLTVKLLFRAGSAHDPADGRGLAALSGAMLAEGGSRALRIDEIKQALYPMAGSVDVQVDKEMTTFTLSAHRENWERFAGIALPMLLEPGFRAEDFERLKDAQQNALVQDLRSNNEEELGKERLQERIFAGTPYGHTVLGSVAGIEALALDQVKAFVARAYTRQNLSVGVAGDAPAGFESRLLESLAALPEGPALEPPRVAGRRPQGLEIEILEKDTRATAISFGHPIAVTRSHPDFAALWLARAWFGEHRSSLSHLYGRIREVRGMNYGDYAYIEAFPRGMFQFFPDPNIARRAQIFEVWIRPVAPENAHMALRIALHELQKLVERGLSQEDFEATRNYLMKNVFVMTARQGQQLGYALDSQWHGIGEFTAHMRERLAALTREDVNAAVRRHLSFQDLSVVIVTKDAKGLAEKLIADAPSPPVRYDGEKPAALLAEDQLIGARKLNVRRGQVHITPVEQVFAK